MSVQSSQSSIQRGQEAAYAVQVSAENGSVADVSVTLTSQPSSQKPTFSSGCTKGNGTATCAITSVPDKQPTALHAQIQVASGATSVTSVKLTATASVATQAKWTPPSASATVAVTAAASASSPTSPTSASATSAGSSAGTSSETALPLGPIPSLNGVSSSVISSSLIGAGNASDLFPAIVPSATPGASPGIPSDGTGRAAQPVANSSALAFGKPGLSAQLAGLIALAVAVLLTVTRLSFLRRFRSRKQGG